MYFKYFHDHLSRNYKGSLLLHAMLQLRRPADDEYSLASPVSRHIAMPIIIVTSVALADHHKYPRWLQIAAILPAAEIKSRKL